MSIDDAVRSANPKTITHVSQWMPFSRQDVQHNERESTTGKRVAREFDDPESKISTLMLVTDPHSMAITAYLRCPHKVLYASKLFIDLFRQDNCALVGPDPNAAKRLEAVAKRMGNKPIATMYKTRDKTGASETRGVMGDEAFEGVDYALLIDDIASTGGSICDAADVIWSIKNGKYKGLPVRAACTHGVLKYKGDQGVDAVDRLKQRGIERLYITDTIPQEPDFLERYKDILYVVSSAPLVREAIYRLELGLSVSDMFK